MEYTKLGRSGLNVSRFCLGTMNFGTVTSEKEAFEIMDTALDLGINFFDTSNTYGAIKSGVGGYKGLSEEIIGRWFAQGNNRRERVVLITKCYQDLQNPVDGPNDCKGLSSYKMYRHLDASLKRLQTDHVEVYMMHHSDPTVTWDELWEAYDVMKYQGKVIYAGSSNFSAFDLAKAQRAAKDRHSFGLVCEETRYSLMCRLPELELFPAAKELGIGVMPWSPLQGGLLSGHALELQEGTRSQLIQFTKDRRTEFEEPVRKQLEEFSKLCQEIGEKEAHVAIAWMLRNPAVTGPIIGPRNVEQLKDMVHAFELELSDEFVKKLEELFPGPGIGAPMAYAW